VTFTPNLHTKSEFRSYAKKIISELDPKLRDQISLKVQDEIRKILQTKAAKKVISYRSDRWEIDIFPLVEEFPEITFFFPKIITSNERPTLKFLSTDSGWERGNFGIWEPKEDFGTKEIHPSIVDLIFLPGLAFHEKGYRLGKGLGYYDQNLQEVPRKSIYAVIWEVCNGMPFPYEVHDIRAGFTISENGLNSFLD
jgi:5-formyltetrahydrofolate cyclo-ligase